MYFDWYARDAKAIMDKIRAGESLGGEAGSGSVGAHYGYFKLQPDSYTLSRQGTCLPR